MLIIRITQILSISLKQRMRLYLFLNTRFPLLKFLWEYLILLAPSPGIFRWLKNGAVSSSAASQEHGAALENRAQQETPRSQLPPAPASPPDPVVQRIYIHKYFKAEQGRSQRGSAGWIPAKGRDLFPSRGMRGCSVSRSIPCPGMLSRLLAWLNRAEQNPLTSPAFTLFWG